MKLEDDLKRPFNWEYFLAIILILGIFIFIIFADSMRTYNSMAQVERENIEEIYSISVMKKILIQHMIKDHDMEVRAATAHVEKMMEF